MKLRSIKSSFSFSISLLFVGLVLVVVMIKAAVAAGPGTLDGAVNIGTDRQQQVPRRKCLTIDTIYPGIREMEYAVRGTVVIAADRINDELKSTRRDGESDKENQVQVPKEKKYPFDKILYNNIGNPHALGQAPLTWPRQVMALVDLPDAVGVDHPQATSLFPADAIARARQLKAYFGRGGSGAYTHSQGLVEIRREVAEFITQRDGGVPSFADNIFLTNGASAGIEMVLSALIANPNCGVMIPIPQYPLYSATLDFKLGHKIGYYLDEDHGWALSRTELERAYNEARHERGIDVRALVVINPGNPSGSVLTRENLHEVVQFCADHNLVLLADEVYQENVYGHDDGVGNDGPGNDGDTIATAAPSFVSCKRAAYDAGLLDNDAIELVSFHSTSKGVFGECGRRGGYMELVGIDREVHDQLYKLASSFLCCTTNGQIMTSLMVRGPDASSPSYHSHEAEKKAIWESLQRRSGIVSKGFQSIPGFTCQPAIGAMYCFPSIQLPAKLIQQASTSPSSPSPDTTYALSLLERTGICVIPASGFGQREGRSGFRTTFLANESDLIMAMEKIRHHYEEFCREYK